MPLELPPEGTLPREIMQRTMDALQLLEEYALTGPGGAFARAIVREAILAAMNAALQSDPIELLNAHKALGELE